MMNACQFELDKHIVPFWNNMLDERGGFYGQMTQELAVYENAPKGVVMHSRILWFYSEMYRLNGDERMLRNAEHAYNFLIDKCTDKSFGGVYWMMNVDGTPADDSKYTYNQAFAIYALSAFYRASGNHEALKYALKLFDVVEECAHDEIFYGDAFTVDWEPARNDELSENGLMAEKTMNTALHLIEAYTELFRISEDHRVESALRYLLKIMVNNIYDGSGGKLKVFFDYSLNEIGNIHSYGHDIEASWLLDRACEVIGDDQLTAMISEITMRIAENIYSIALRNDSVLNERDDGMIDTRRIWWVQAEAVIGFLNAYRKSGNEKYLSASMAVLNFIRTYQIDKRCGEWFPELDDSFKPISGFDMAGPWKCPYHNGRMCIEVIRRIGGKE